MSTAKLPHFEVLNCVLVVSCCVDFVLKNRLTATYQNRLHPKPQKSQIPPSMSDRGPLHPAHADTPAAPHPKPFFVPAALGELRHGLRDGLLLELGPGEAFMQESSVVLLAGKLLMTGKADSVPLQQYAGSLPTPSTLFCFVVVGVQKRTPLQKHAGSLPIPYTLVILSVFVPKDTAFCTCTGHLLS